MKKNYLITSVVFTTLAISAYWIIKNKSENRTYGNSLGAAMSVAGENDAKERDAYEINRLMDPGTGKIPYHIREKELAFAATLPTDAYAVSGKLASASNWVSRGPWNVGGRTRAFGMDITNDSILIAGSCSGGMWRSVDGGATWAMASTPAQHQNTNCLSQDIRPGHTNVWYMGSGEAYGASAGAGGAYFLGNGAYKSIDNGQTWTSIASTVSGTPASFESLWDLMWNIKTYPADTVNDVVYAATYGAIFRSVNGGTSWTQLLGASNNPFSYFTDVEVTPGGIVYATLSDDGPVKGIFRSSDGVNFTNITPPNFPAAYNRIVIGYAPTDENQVYFLANTPGFGQPDTNFLGDVEWNSIWKYYYISGDGSGNGGDWSDRSANLPTTGGLFDKFQAQGSYDMVVKVKPNDTNVVFIGGTNLYRSTSAFADDTHTKFIGGYLEGASLPVVDLYANHHPDQHQVLFSASNPDVMYSSNDGGVFKTTDNTAQVVNWTSLNNGYLTTMFYTCAIDHATPGDNTVIAGAQDNGTWYTNSAVPTDPWVMPRGGDGSYCFIADNKSTYYFSIQNGKMMKAKVDASGVIDSFARIDPIGATDYQFINPYVLDPNNNNNIMYLAAGKFLWRNNDLAGIPFASNWDSITTNWVQFPDSLLTGEITAVAVSKTPANRVYYGTSKRQVFRMDNANTGTPAPVNITSVTGLNAFPAAGNVSCIAVDPSNADNLMVVFSNYSVYSLYYSSDGGTTWLKCGGNLEVSASGAGNGPSVRWASILPVSNGTVYMVATSTGLYATSNLNGLSTVWVQQSSALIGNAVCDMIDYRQSDGLVVVATHAHGIYSAYITSVNDVLGVPEASAGEQQLMLGNYPNPAGSSTTISFTLLKSQNITLSIYDEGGRLLYNLMNGQRKEGKQEYHFDCSKLKPGVYYYALQMPGFKKTKSMVKL